VYLLAQKTDENFNYQKIPMFLTNNNQPNEFGILINGMSKTPAFSKVKVVEVETKAEKHKYEVRADYPIECLLRKYQSTQILSVQTTFFWQRNWDNDIDGEF
jgi:hypothetical protein